MSAKGLSGMSPRMTSFIPEYITVLSLKLYVMITAGNISPNPPNGGSINDTYDVLRIISSEMISSYLR